MGEYGKEEKTGYYDVAMEQGNPQEAIHIAVEKELAPSYIEKAFEALVQRDEGEITAMAELESEDLPEKYLKNAVKAVVESLMEKDPVLASTRANRYKEYLSDDLMKRVSEKAQEELENTYEDLEEAYEDID